jgi:hypothetical protein
MQQNSKNGRPRSQTPSRNGQALAPDLHLTDLGNAQRLVTYHGREIRYCFPWHKWLHWDGSRWQQDAIGEVTRLAKKTIASLFASAVNDVATISKDLEAANEQVSAEG